MKSWLPLLHLILEGYVPADHSDTKMCLIEINCPWVFSFPQCGAECDLRRRCTHPSRHVSAGNPYSSTFCPPEATGTFDPGAYRVHSRAELSNPQI